MIHFFLQALWILDNPAYGVGIVFERMIHFFLQALWILAFFRRRKVIGGALLVFFVQVFVKMFMSVINILGVLIALERHNRIAPIDKRVLYEVSLILFIDFAASAVTTIAALAALKTRSWRHVPFIRAGYVHWLRWLSFSYSAT